MFLKRRLTEEKLQVDALDGLRGTAALLVVLSHTSNLNMFFVPGFDFRGTGKSGVFLFFLLSSFLLTRQMIIAADQFLRPSFWLLYWRRRFFRIYPFYFAYLALAIVTTHLSARMLGNGNHAQPFELDLAGLVRHLFLEESKGLTWSISVEFKFYFLLPFICGLFLLARGRGYLLSAIFLSLMVLSQVISPQSEAEPNSSRLLPYMPIFLSGIFLAFIHDRYQTQLVRFSAWLGAIGVAGVIVMMPAVFSQMAGNVDGSYFHKQFLLHSAVWSMILLAVINCNGALNRFFSLPALRSIGLMSFSVYLIHPIFLNAALLLQLSSYFAAWFVLAGTLLASFVTYRFIEYPCSRISLSNSMSLWRRPARLSCPEKPGKQGLDRALATVGEPLNRDIV